MSEELKAPSFEDMQEARRRAIADARKAVKVLQKEGFQADIVSDENTSLITVVTTDTKGRRRQFEFTLCSGVGVEIERRVRDPGPMPGEER
ncbi:MAG: hypothetical protein Q7S84_02735 [bacterium]|nr:hypothetical protein [bacterium]